MFDHIGKIDIFFIILFIFAVSFTIGFSVINMIDKKISNVSINIPPLQSPTITLSVSEQDKDKINIYTCNNKENFTVSDAQDVNNYPELRQEALKYDPNNAPEIKVVSLPESKIYNPPEEDRNYVCNSDFGFRAPSQHVSCSNASISDKFTYGKEPIIPNQIACGSPNKLTAENYYKTFDPRLIPMDPMHVKGYNYMAFDQNPSPYIASTMRILSTNTKGLPSEALISKNIPVGHNAALPPTTYGPMVGMP